MKLFLLSLCLLGVFTARANVYFVTSNANSGTGTLRQAINDANSHTGTDSIKFNLADASVAGRTIILGSAFPSITDKVIIDGTSQTAGNNFGISFAKILVTSSTTIPQCFSVDADSCEIYGIFISGFETGILINKAFVKIGAINKGNVIFNCSSACVDIETTDHTVFIANLIGIDTSQNVAAGTPGDGIYVNSCYAVSIGGHGSFSGNVISGNNFGIKFENSAYCDVMGNFIGTSSNGLNAIPNEYGIRGSGVSNTNMSIGGDSSFERNILSGNTHAGIYGSFSTSVFQGNYIGTDVSGNHALANGDAGIYLSQGSSNNLIGDDTGVLPNMIAFNGQEAIFLQGSTCVNNTVRRNLTYCNNAGGFVFNGANGSINPPSLSIANANGVTGVTSPNGIVDLFGDDTCSHCEGKTLIASVTASSNGVYTYSGSLSGNITATVTDTAGNTSEYASCVPATSTACIVTGFTTSSGVCANSSASFFDQTVTQPGTTVTNWQWDFGDGGTSASQSPSHVYSTTGSFTVMLITTNNIGCEDTLSKSINVTGPPTASFNPPLIACVGSTVLFQDESTAGAGATLTSWFWDFGDGTSSSLQNPSHNYDSLGTYNVSLSITNSNLCTDEFVLALTVLSPPEAAFTFTNNDLQVTFTNTSFVYGAASYIWDFGDGVTSNAEEPMHSYPSGGIYTVCLTAYDSLCMSADSVCQTVNLPVGIDDPTAEIMHVAPNPVQDIITISGWSSSLPKESISVYDMTGRRMPVEIISSGTSTYKLNLKPFAEGLYELHINSEGHQQNIKIAVIH